MINFENVVNDKSFQISGLTVLAFCSAYYYELGFCSYYHIPSYFISLEISRYGYMLPLILGSMIIIYFLYSGFALGSIENKEEDTINNRIKYSILGIIVILFSYILMRNFITTEFIFLLLVLVYGIVITTLKNFRNTIESRIHERRSQIISIFLLSKSGEKIGKIIIISSSILILSFSLGNIFANRNRNFYVKNDNRTILINKYGNTTIWGEIDNLKISRLIIDTDGRTDTLTYKKSKDVLNNRTGVLHNQ